MDVNALFYLGIIFILIHEIDAIRCKEWRIFPGLSHLSEKTGKYIFIVAHIPLITLLIWILGKDSYLILFRVGFDIFLVIHLLVHSVYLKHRNNEFRDWLSWFIIVFTAFCGAGDLVILFFNK